MGQPHDKSPWASSCGHCSVLVVWVQSKGRALCYQAKEGGCSPAALGHLHFKYEEAKGHRAAFPPSAREELSASLAASLQTSDNTLVA